MEEEDYFTQTQLPALIAALAAAVMAARLLPLTVPLSLLFSSHSHFLLCSKFAALSRCLFIGKNCTTSSSYSSTAVAALMVAAHGLHHFVNDWCNYHCRLLTMATLLLSVGCKGCCPLMEISQQ
jgi:predicted ABC-type sugar transport system permease subunit